MLTIIDYGMGNLRSVQKALEHLGSDTLLTSQPQDILKAKKIILPGVGAFAQAMNNLKKLNLLDPLKEILTKDVPFLGICLGMQLLLSTSEEHGKITGLDRIKGQVKYFRNTSKFPKNIVVPHMGWNDLNIKKKNSLFKGIPDQSKFYFVHSYYVAPADKSVICAETAYGIKFCSALHENNIYGVQFHPEKSGEVGLAVLKNFISV